VEIIAANPWAVLVSSTDEAPLASHIPVILDRGGEPRATLLGHLARANPHSRLLSRRGRFRNRSS
jgi:transcriptional regulator